MEEAIIIPVFVGDREIDLLLVKDDDNIITIKLDGKSICSGDWTDNFKLAFKRALEIWK